MNNRTPRESDPSSGVHSVDDPISMTSTHEMLVSVETACADANVDLIKNAMNSSALQVEDIRIPMNLLTDQDGTLTKTDRPIYNRQIDPRNGDMFAAVEAVMPQDPDRLVTHTTLTSLDEHESRMHDIYTLPLKGGWSIVKTVKHRAFLAEQTVGPNESLTTEVILCRELPPLEQVFISPDAPGYTQVDHYQSEQPAQNE